MFPSRFPLSTKFEPEVFGSFITHVEQAAGIAIDAALRETMQERLTVIGKALEDHGLCLQERMTLLAEKAVQAIEAFGPAVSQAEPAGEGAMSTLIAAATPSGNKWRQIGDTLIETWDKTVIQDLASRGAGHHELQNLSRSLGRFELITEELAHVSSNAKAPAAVAGQKLMAYAVLPERLPSLESPQAQAETVVSKGFAAMKSISVGAGHIFKGRALRQGPKGLAATALAAAGTAGLAEAGREALMGGPQDQGGERQYSWMRAGAIGGAGLAVLATALGIASKAARR